MEQNNFFIEARVYYADTDTQGVIYHSTYLDFAERARTEFLREKGIIQSKLLSEQNILFAAKSINIEYNSPGKLDDVLVITVEPQESKGIIIKMEQKIYRKEGNVLLCKLNVEFVTLNKDFKPIRLPKEIRELITKI